MIRTDEVIALLKAKKNKMLYNDIRNSVKDSIMKSLTVELEETQVKSDLYMSLIEDENIIMVGEGYWDLKERYSLENLQVIERSRMTEETEIHWDESEDTKELKLSLVYKSDDEDDFDDEDEDSKGEFDVEEDED